MSRNKRFYVKKINKTAAQGSRRVDLMFKQASLKAFTSDFDVCDKDLGIDSVSSATCIESNESVHQPNLSATVSTSALFQRIAFLTMECSEHIIVLL